MTLQELSTYDGKEGRRAYIAYDGNIYDVTDSPLWKEGTHKKLHQAGQDLTEAMSKAPHAQEVFAKFEIVGKLEVHMDHMDELKHYLTSWYQKYHPHPMLVHFPIALHLFAGGFDLLFLLMPSPIVAATVFFSFLIATTMGVFALFAGMLSWWINYNLAMTKIFIIKLVVSVLSTVLGVVAIMLYLPDPDMIYTNSMDSIAYHTIVLLTALAVIVLGYYGGKITWPDKDAS